MLKEERVLFPYFASWPSVTGRGRAPSPFGTVENPIRMMEREHREAADALRNIRGLTANYSAPADGCATYAACMAELERLNATCIAMCTSKTTFCSPAPSAWSRHPVCVSRRRSRKCRDSGNAGVRGGTP